MPKKLTSLSGAFSGWPLYYVSLILFTFLDQLGDYIFGISDFIMKTASVGLIVVFSFALAKEARKERKHS
ncbi:hypothetical protein CEH05_15985 [Halobacillus halophilus]|uniref:Uncharacterized protein n=1 Tax=Halobacillus halophilus (strain ATCC 35676 / DSM 2266 / JCM 20832 / KCTC 3685 / LMG 17431 / NBRC 102448 / NCIMB 2269) TaxID=866895 RepID=I0JR00_HALH3|nr:hypothetical protein [Halobacillus halophilus]ASF40570.1 hypothetical protein CEH05_15985 [Halobacillus halophilus]CCG46570.1 hypothetical protein HBHAL_4228 [Halobacillus halophilus DSM 2266]